MFYLSVISYWFFVSIYFIMDIYIYMSNQWNVYKLQSYSNRVWDRWFNDVFISILNSIYTLCLSYIFPIYYDSIYPSVKDIYKLALYIIFIDLYFYILHRYMHFNKYLYKHVHKHHHETNITVAASGFNSSILEHIILNIGSLYIPHMFIQGSYFLISLLVIIGGYSSASSHSGYINCIQHNKHHQLLSVNYGNGLYIWDTVFSTFE